MSSIQQLGNYRIMEVLGKGSMGVVYKGVDPRIGKLVAIKTMNQKHLSDPHMQERFYREGNILGQLNHRNIINVYNVGQDDEICYIAMEYLDGISLEKIIRGPNNLSLVQSLDVVRQVCEGVHAAHQQGIIHRDLKPANIVVLEGDHVKVLDFGVARFKNSQLTTSGVVIGTINYIAPEQITGLKIDHRADIFSIGVVLYELLAKRHPFIGKNISQTMVRIINNQPPAIHDIPPALNSLVHKALEKDREQRPQTCMELADLLEEIKRTESLVDTLNDVTIVDPELQKAQQAYIRKLVEERVGSITEALRKERIDEAEELLRQIRGMIERSDVIDDLDQRLAQAKRKQAEKVRFVSQMTHETLLKANQLMQRRQFVNAIELCNKALRMDSRNQDARIIKASCIKKLQRFLKQVDHVN